MTLSTDAETRLEKVRDSVRLHSGVIGIVGCFLVLSLIYNGLTPLFEAPDEFDHLRYGLWLADRKGLPHLITDLQAAGHEIGQPPLYYLLLSLWLKPFDTSDFFTVAPQNPYWRQGAGPNVHYHFAAEEFPYQKTALAVHVARLGSSLLGVVAILGTYGIARLLLPGFAWLPAALIAFNPQFIFISSVISNDNLITAVSTIILFILVKGLIKPPLRKEHYLLLGLLWGTAVLSKVSGLAIGAVIFLGLVFFAAKGKHWRTVITGSIPVGIGFAIIAGWWFVRNTTLYGDPLAWDAFLNANRGLIRPLFLSLGEAINRLGFTITRTFWASFNYGLLAPDIYFYLTNLILLLGGLGLLVWLLRTGIRQIAATQTLAFILLVGWTGIVSISLLRWIQQVGATEQGRLLFPAISSFAILLSLGLVTLFHKYSWVLKGTVGLLAIAAIALPFIIIQPAFAQPDPLAQSASISNPTDIQFGDSIELLGYDLKTHSVHMGEPIELDLFWDNTAPIADSYVVALHVVDSSGEVISRLDTIPYNGRFATAVWPPNTPFRDPYTLPPIAENAAPGLATIWLTLHPWLQIEQTLPVTVDDILVGNNLVLARVKIAPDDTIEVSPDQPRADQIATLAQLAGYDLVQTDGAIDITFYWQAQQPTTTDYTVFVHLIDANGNAVAQADSPPQQNNFPTSIWETGETIIDIHTIILPDAAAPGSYTIMVGFYDPATGQRLPAFAAEGAPWLNQQIEVATINLNQ